LGIKTNTTARLFADMPITNITNYSKTIENKSNILKLEQINKTKPIEAKGNIKSNTKSNTKSTTKINSKTNNIKSNSKNSVNNKCKIESNTQSKTKKKQTHINSIINNAKHIEYVYEDENVRVYYIDGKRHIDYSIKFIKSYLKQYPEDFEELQAKYPDHDLSQYLEL
jgi:hypothetical protein